MQIILSLLPEPAATAFAVAAFMGLRHGEIQGLLWENYRDGEMYVSRSIWNGHVTAPKDAQGPRTCSGDSAACRTAGDASATVRQSASRADIRQLARKAALHEQRCKAGDSSGAQSLRTLPQGRKQITGKADHQFKRDARYPEWHGWHAARRGLGSNLYRLGVPEMVIQRILRHANVSTTATYYIKTAADDVRNAMAKLEQNIPSGIEAPKCFGTPNGH